MHRYSFRLPLLVGFLSLVASCDRPADSTVTSQSDAVVAPTAASAQMLRMRIDGVEWGADQNLFGAVHPNGYDRAVMISGSNGPKDANEQTFNINLYGIEGPGTFRVQSGNPSNHVAQMANLGPGRDLVGGPMGFDLSVEFLRLTANPTHIEARFDGTMTASNGVVLPIDRGEFRYVE